MEEAPDPAPRGHPPTAAQRRIAEHDAGRPLLLLGPAGSGRSEAIAMRIAALAASGAGPRRACVLTSTGAGAARIRARTEALLGRADEEPWIDTAPAIGERLLREHALEAGLDPFFVSVQPPDRLAILLDRVDELPLRRHEIRGNPAGLLARLLERIDVLKAEGVGPGDLREWATVRERAAASEAEREAARREVELAELYGQHDRILRGCGSLDSGDLVLEAERLLRRRPDVRERLGERFVQVIADEYEDAGRALRSLLRALAPHGNLLLVADPGQAIHRFRSTAPSPGTIRDEHPGLVEVASGPGLRGWPRMRAAAAAVAALVPGDAPDADPPPADGDGAPSREDGLPEVAGPAGRERSTDGDGHAAGDRSPSAEEGAPPGDEARDRNAVEPDAAVRLWRCTNERAEAQAVAREIEHLLAAGEVRAERICVVCGPGQREERLVAAALEERSVPFRTAGAAALFRRPEVRDAIAWLRMLADPTDSAAVVRALTRPPVELRSVDLARCTTIARRRKLDMISALEAAIDSPQLPPESRDRVRAFLKLYRSAGGAVEELRADVFVRRLIERIGLRRQNLFAASPQTAERLVNLSRLADLAAEWSRREPRGSTRDFVRYLSAVAEAGERFDGPAGEGPRDAVLLARPTQVKGLELDHVYLLGLHREALRGRPDRDSWIPEELLAEPLPEPGATLSAARRARLAYTAISRARRGVVLSWPEEGADDAEGPSPVYEAVRDALGVGEERHAEELFGPAEGLHSTYRIVRDEVLEASWRAGAALSEMRLDTAEDVNDAVARFLELLKLAALIQRPGNEPASEALAALNELLERVATPEQRAALSASALDEHVLGEERERSRRREMVAARKEPSLEAFLPTTGAGLGLSASDIELYRTCPLKYKFARVFAIPQEPTINQRFGIVIHQVLERFHAEEMRGAGPGGLERLLELFEAAWRRAGFGASDDELQYRDRAVAALTRYRERDASSASRPVWLERGFAFAIGEHRVRGRIDRVDRLPDGGYELIDYKTGEPKTAGELAGDVQLALYRIGAREDWRVEPKAGSYWYVLEDRKVPVPGSSDELERVERTVLEVAEGIAGQDFEPRPDFEVCSWCDYRLICPASEA